MQTSLSTIELANTIPRLESNLDPALQCQINILTRLGAGVVQEVERLQLLLATNGMNLCLVDGRDQVIFGNGVNFYAEVRRFEIALIRTALRQSQGSQTGAARLLQMKITTLNSKIKHYKILKRKLVSI